jgi:hypothetical protein
MNEEIILQTLKEIRDDQKVIVDKISRMDREMEISRNGYTPHEVVELFHFVDDLKKREEKKAENIRKAVINWITPILLSGVILGLLQMYKG